MIGKEAQEYLNKNKDIIDKVILIDYEGNGIKCLYFEPLEDVINGYHWKESAFMTDDGEWDTEEPYNDNGEVTYTILKGVTFKTSEELENLEIVEKNI